MAKAALDSLSAIAGHGLVGAGSCSTTLLAVANWPGGSDRRGERCGRGPGSSRIPGRAV